MAEFQAPMTLRLLTPDGFSSETACESVVLVLRNGAGGQEGGYIGIQRGHAPAMLALGEGRIRASLGQKVVFLAHVADGFASVRDDVITVITDSAELEELPREE